MTVSNPASVDVSLAKQSLTLHDSAGVPHSFSVSTAANGAGSAHGSNCTPLGLHRVRLKIGADCPLGTVFVGRRPTGESYSEALAAQHPDRDWILTRILWLQGMEHGQNRGKGVDSLRRFIYIHGTPEESRIGEPVSHGCIRMCNNDVIDLFDRVQVGCIVSIQA